MKFLTKKHADDLLKRQKEAASGLRQTWDPYYDEHCQTKATLLIPCGELMNENIRGFVLAWNMKGAINFCPVPDKVQLKAHGLEGAFTVQTSLVTALIVYGELPEYRCAIAIEKQVPQLLRNNRRNSASTKQTLENDNIKLKGGELKMKKTLYTHDHLKDDGYLVCHALLDELMSVQLINNTGDDAELAWRKIANAVVQIVAPAERELAFLRKRVKTLEEKIGTTYNSRYAFCTSCGEEVTD